MNRKPGRYQATDYFLTLSRLLLASGPALLLLLAGAPAASADYSVDRFVGEGQFNLPSGVAVDEGTGQIYASNGRPSPSIVRLSAEGEFELVFGRGVSTGGTSAEVCGAPIDQCYLASEGDREGTFSTGSSLAFNSDTRRLYVLDNGDNRRVQEFRIDDNGTPANSSDDLPEFVRAWGWGVDDGSEEFQICTSDCQGGIRGIGEGQIDSFSSSGNRLAISPLDDDIFLADQTRPDPRVLRFNPDGTFVKELLIPPSRITSTASLGIAIDSRGILYITDVEGDGEIERYDTEAVHGPEGFLAPIPAPPLLLASSTDPATQSLSFGGLAISADSDGAGPETDRLFVFRTPNEGLTTLETSVIQRFDSPGEEMPPATGSGPVMEGEFDNVPSKALAYDSVRDRLIVASHGTERAGEAGPGVYVLDQDGTTPDVEVSDPSADSVEAHGIAVSGDVNPMGGRARYWLAYSRAGEEEWSATALESVSGQGDQPVSVEIEGLEANTSYEVRWQARKVLGPNKLATDTSTAVTIDTEAIPPTVATGPPHSFDDESAWLTAEINAENSATEFYFDIGTDQTYGNTVPGEPISAGSAGRAETFMARASGLEPGTTYHYRVRAESPEGESIGADRTFTTRPEFSFPERAYEQVSPVDKLDIDISYGNQTFGSKGFIATRPVAADGNAAAFRAWQALDSQEWGGNVDSGDYVARRTVSGWKTEAVRPRPGNTLHLDYKALSLSWPDFDRALLWSTAPLTDPPVQGQLYVHDLTDGSISEFDSSTQTSTLNSVTSDDIEHVAFAVDDMLVSEPGLTAERKVYEYHDGEVRLVSWRPGDAGAFSERAALAGERAPSAISASGEHIFFETPHGINAPTELYRRSNGTETVKVSVSTRSPEDPQGTKSKEFQGATPDGEIVFFTSAEELTDEADTGQDRQGNELYRHDLSQGELRAVSAETNTANGVNVLGVVGFSESGDTVYYVGEGRSVAGEGVAGGRNLYRWQADGTPAGETRYIATLDQSADCIGDSRLLMDACVFHDVVKVRTARVSADGEVLAFQSTGSLTGQHTGGHAQIYVYEAKANRGVGALSCASCRPSGERSEGWSHLPRSEPVAGTHLSPLLSVDGNRVVFESSDRITGGDRNMATDVYIWEAGRVRLISSGISESDSTLSGVDPSGDNVFFITRDSLVGQDTDDLLDVYVARVGGGIAAQSPPEPDEPCAGEDCRGVPSQAPEPRKPATPEFEGPGNVAGDEPGHPSLSCRPLARRALQLTQGARKAQRLARRAVPLARRGAVRPARARAVRRRAVLFRQRSTRLIKRTRACRARARGEGGPR